MRKITATSISLLLMASTSSIAQVAKFDAKIAEAAAKKVAEKIGDIRPGFDFDQKPEMVTRDDVKDKSINTSYLPEPSYGQQKELKPISNNEYTPEIDYMVTSSIKSIVPRLPSKVVWEKFDRYGNLIEVK